MTTLQSNYPNGVITKTYNLGNDQYDLKITVTDGNGNQVAFNQLTEDQKKELDGLCKIAFDCLNQIKQSNPDISKIKVETDTTGKREIEYEGKKTNDQLKVKVGSSQFTVEMELDHITNRLNSMYRLKKLQEDPKVTAIAKKSLLRTVASKAADVGIGIATLAGYIYLRNNFLV